MSQRSLSAELIAEFLGTFILLLFGQGSVAMVVLFGSGIPNEVVNGGYTNIVIGWGLGVTFGIYAAGKITGAHLNPAVTVALACFRGFPWTKVLPYSLAQIAGAFAASALVFWNYLPAFRAFDPNMEKTAGIFTTFPAFPAQLSAGFLDQVLGTALLLFLIFALTDERNQPSGILTPILVGLVVVAIGISFGKLHGYAINPARDFGPRLFVMLAGFRNNGLSDGSMVFLVPILGPLLGGVLGGWLYNRAIGRFLSKPSA
ncbi:MAG: aquaporin family protein [Bryobacterales bacterium]|jgi:glycerol uptake facilitator protein|nr:aquaporin family protein [Bryobacterales bacterium]